MKIFYIRVSTQEQNEARQVEMAKQHEAEKVFIEKASGKNTNREQLKEMMNFVRCGDVVIVESISRIARNTKDLLNIVDELTKKEVEFISLKESIDTRTPQGKFMLTVFGAIAELEREQTLERQREGIACAKAEGKYKGKPQIEYNKEEFERECKLWKEGKQTATETMKKLNVKPNTFYRRVKQWGL